MPPELAPPLGALRAGAPFVPFAACLVDGRLVTRAASRGARSSTDWNRARKSRSTPSPPPRLFARAGVSPLALVLRTDDVMNEAPAPVAPAPPEARTRARFEALSVSGFPGESDSSPSRPRLGLLRLFRSEKPALIMVLRPRDLASLRSCAASVVREGRRTSGGGGQDVLGRVRASERASCVPSLILPVGRSDGVEPRGGRT